MVHLKLGELYFNFQQWESSLQEYQSALRILQEQNGADSIFIYAPLFRIGECQARNLQLEPALETFHSLTIKHFFSESINNSLSKIFLDCTDL